MKEAARMRLETQYRRGNATSTGFRRRGAQNRPMTRMQTVEIADRDDGAASVIGQTVMVAKDAHIFSSNPASNMTGSSGSGLLRRPAATL